MKALVASIVLAAGLASSALAFAQTPPLSIEVIPNSPTTRSPVTIRVGIDRCNVGPSTVTYPAPNEIRFDISTIFCPGLIFGPVEFTIGQLPAGVYTVSVFTGSVPRGSATFTVLAASASGAAPIPTLSEFALLGLMLVVGLTGAIHRRKHKSNLFSVATLCLTAAAAVLVPSFSGGGRTQPVKGRSTQVSGTSHRAQERLRAVTIEKTACPMLLAFARRFKQIQESERRECNVC
ncbi:MAG: hypothetical protein KJ007_16340 [Burkholderiales bacterium]|nr:hypothetical protein [Burkholderiales bacterium]